ncbi:MAG: phosphate ABC transporter substrate-binding protein PstS [Actinobacteria bacterium]|nr:phosphate ABC transporter substrate-binding protein PstS [Actinomycetota bacterium]
MASVGALALTACSSSDSSGSGSSIKASGSSAQKNAMTEWISAYQQANHGSTIEYQANGSGAGIQDFNNSQTAFAGSDSAISGEDLTAANARCAGGPAINIPMVGGAIVAAYNVEGVDKLELSSSVLAQIFSSKITKWNDPAIANLNPGVNLPDATIVQYHRSDSSGTTDNFTQFLKTSAPNEWSFETGKDWVAPGGQGSKGNDGVSSSIKSTANSIGYVELAFAQDQNLPVASIDNGGGAVVPSSESASQGIETAKVIGTGNNLALQLDYSTKTPGAYPIVLVTYEITCEKGLSADQLPLTKSFLEYTATPEAQSKLTEIGYVPMPTDLLTKVNVAVGSIS